MMGASNSSQNTTTVCLPRDVATQSGYLVAGLPQTAIHSPNAYAPQTHQQFYYGYGNTPGDWGDYRPFLAADNLGFGSSGIYNDNPSLMFHGGYGYSHSSYIDSSEIVRRAWKRYNLSLGLGLNKVAGKVFRISYLGNLNEVDKDNNSSSSNNNDNKIMVNNCNQYLLKGHDRGGTHNDSSNHHLHHRHQIIVGNKAIKRHGSPPDLLHHHHRHKEGNMIRIPKFEENRITKVFRGRIQRYKLLEEVCR